MKILYSCPLDPVTLAAPGYHVASVVNEMLAKGHEVCLLHKGPELAEVPTEVQVALRYNAPKGVSRITSDIVFLFRLLQLLFSRKFDFVYHRFEKWSILPVFAARIFKPIIVEINAGVRTELINQGKSKLTRLMFSISERIQIKFASMLIVVAEGIGAELSKRFPQDSFKIHVVENGTDEHSYYPKDRTDCINRLGLDPIKKYVVFAGRLQEWQGVESIIASASIVANEIDDFQFLILGDGPLEEQMVSQIDTLGVGHLFQMLGWRSKNEVCDFFGASDVCLAPYSSSAGSPSDDDYPPIETILLSRSPLKLFSYMACARAVVTSNFKDCGVRVEQWNVGLGCEPDDPADLAAKVIQLLNDRDEADSLGANGVERIRSFHTWSKVVDKILELSRRLKTCRSETL